MTTTALDLVYTGQLLASGGDSDSIGNVGLLFFLSGFLFYGFMFLRYRNVDKRHQHAKETEVEIDNVQARDDFVGKRNRQRNRRMDGANERQIEGAQNTGLVAGVLRALPSDSVQRVFNNFGKP